MKAYWAPFRLFCTIAIEFLQAQENKELKKALKMTRCTLGDPLNFLSDDLCPHGEVKLKYRKTC